MRHSTALLRGLVLLLILASLVLILSCAKSFPVHPYGPDTYVVYVDSVSRTKARHAALKTANEYCAEHNRVMMPDYEKAESAFDPWAGQLQHVEFVFHCFDESDPGLHPPEMRPTQRLIIEDD